MNLRQIIRESIDNVILDSIISEAIEEEIGSAEQAPQGDAGQAQPGSGGQTNTANQQQNDMFKQYADQLRKLLGNGGIDPKPVQNNQAAAQHIVKLNRFVYAVINAIDSGNIYAANSPAAGNGYSRYNNPYGKDKVDMARDAMRGSVNYLGGQAENLLGNGTGLQNNPLNGVFNAGVNAYNNTNNLFTQQINNRKYSEMYGNTGANNTGYDLYRLMSLVADGCYPLLRDEYIQLSKQNNGIFSATPNVGNCYDVLNNLYHDVQQYVAQSKQKTQAGGDNGQQNAKTGEAGDETGQPENGGAGGEAGSPENGGQPEGTPQEKLFRIYEELAPLVKQIDADSEKLERKFPSIRDGGKRGTKEHLRNRAWYYQSAFNFVYWHINRGYSNNDENELRNVITAKNTNSYYEGSSFSNYTTIDMALKMFDYGNVYANKLGGIWKKVYSREYLSKAKELLEEYNNIAKQLISNGQPLLPQQQEQPGGGNTGQPDGEVEAGGNTGQPGGDNTGQPDGEVEAGGNTGQPGGEVEAGGNTGQPGGNTEANAKTGAKTQKPKTIDFTENKVIDQYKNYFMQFDKTNWTNPVYKEIAKKYKGETLNEMRDFVFNLEGTLGECLDALETNSIRASDENRTRRKSLTRILGLTYDTRSDTSFYNIRAKYNKINQATGNYLANLEPVGDIMENLIGLYNVMRNNNMVDKKPKNSNGDFSKPFK